MAWKIIGIIESRAGDLEFLPAWAIGEPNTFDNPTHANLVRESMQSIVDTQRAPRSTTEAPKLPPIKYMLVPCIDESTIAQLNGAQPKPAAVQPPSLSFGGNGAPQA